jgi:MFS family permease
MHSADIQHPFHHSYFRSSSYCFQDHQFDPTHAQLKGLLTSILELGAFFGSLIAGPMADAYSRKVSSIYFHALIGADTPRIVLHLWRLYSVHFRDSYTNWSEF